MLQMDRSSSSRTGWDGGHGTVGTPFDMLEACELQDWVIYDAR